MGIYTKRSASLLVMGVGGGAFFPSAQGAFADGTNTRLSYLINAVGFSTVAFYGAGMRVYNARYKRKLENVEANSVHKAASSTDSKLSPTEEKLEHEFVN